MKALFESRAAVLKAEAEAKLADKLIELERMRAASASRAQEGAEAVQLADSLGSFIFTSWDILNAANCLRRLHAENERLKSAMQAPVAASIKI